MPGRGFTRDTILQMVRDKLTGALTGINLADADLQGIDLSFINLEEAILTRANLQGVNLRFANLRGAWLVNANLSKADLRGANLDLAHLYGADLTEAVLGPAESVCARGDDFEEILAETGDILLLKCANLESADLRKAKFHKANLRFVRFVCIIADEADFTDAILEYAILAFTGLYGSAKQAIFRGANLREASLSGDLSGAVFERANLEGADLDGAILRGANVRGANLRGAKLAGADLTDADLTDADLTGAEWEERKSWS